MVDVGVRQKPSAAMVYAQIVGFLGLERLVDEWHIRSPAGHAYIAGAMHIITCVGYFIGAFAISYVSALFDVAGAAGTAVSEGLGSEFTATSISMSRASYLFMFAGACQIGLSFLVMSKFPTEIRSSPNVFNAVSAANLAAMLGIANMLVG